MEFHKDIYTDLCFSIYILVIFSLLSKKLILKLRGDNTPYVTAKNLDDVIKSLEEDSIKLFQ